MLGLSGIILAGCTSKPTATLPENTPIIQPVSEEAKNDEILNKGPQYVEFSPTVLSQSASTRRVLFFYANWCPTCRPANESFTNNVAQLPDDVTLIRVNYNDSDTDQTEKDLAKKYGVTYQHTFVQIDSEGNKVAIWNGGEIDELLSKLK